MLTLFLTFCKFGLLCFGGGYMLIPLFNAEFVEKGILTPEVFGNLISISQLTPGPVGINAATFVGFMNNSVAGAAVATVGLVFPTLILAGFATKFIYRYKEHKLMQGLLYGARLGAAALVVFAVIIFCKLSLLESAFPQFWKGEFFFPVFSVSGIVIAVTSFVLIHKFKLSTTWVILISAGMGAAAVFINNFF